MNISDGHLHGPRNHRKTIRWALRIFTLLALVSFLCFRAYVIKRRAHPIVRYKPEVEIARMRPPENVYPCLVFQSEGKSDSLSGEFKQCRPQLTNDAPVEQFEIDLDRGGFVLRTTDLSVADDMPLVLTRTYNTWDRRVYGFGVGSNHPYDIYFYGNRSPYTYLNVVTPASEVIHFNRISEGTGYADAVYEDLRDSNTLFHGARLRWNQNHWDLNFQDGSVYRFPESYYAKRPAEMAIVGMRNAAGEEIKFVRDAARNLVRITSPHEHWIRFAYDAQNRIITANDDANSLVKYSYDETGRVVEVKGASGVLWSYSYDDGRIAELRNSSGAILFKNKYEKTGLIASVTLRDGRSYRFDYLFGKGYAIVETTVVDPKGKVLVFHF